MRLFLASVPPVEVCERIADAVDIARGALRARWVPARNLHVTLTFLGDQPEDRVETIVTAASQAAVDTAGFALEWGEVGAFSSFHRARVLFLRAQRGGDELTALAASVFQRLPDTVRPEAKPFRAHLTLARFRSPPPPVELEAVAYALAGHRWQYAAHDFELVHSELRPDGARYQTLERFPLRG